MTLEHLTTGFAIACCLLVVFVVLLPSWTELDRERRNGRDW